jgi:hypothetical protein
MFALQKNVCSTEKILRTRQMFGYQENVRASGKCWSISKDVCASPENLALCAPPKKALLSAWPGKVPQ